MKGKTVIVTGASSGIGKACAEVFGKAGANLVITGRKLETLKPVSDDLKRFGVDNLAIVADASKEEDNQKMVEETFGRYGRIDILINNAGISMRAMFEDLDLEVFRKVMDINLMGSVYATKYCLPHILQSKGSIIGVSSINGYRGTPARTAYTASKYAMNGFFEALRTEVMNRGVHVLVIAPGFTGTNIRNVALGADGLPQGESPRDEASMMTSEEVALRILKATRKRKRDLILTRLGKTSVFLNKWIPGLLDKIVVKMFAREEGSPLKN